MRLGTVVSASLLGIVVAGSAYAQTPLSTEIQEPSATQILYGVRLAIASEPALQVDGAIIDDSLDSDHFITLTGVVPSKAAKALAESRVEQVRGVRWVMNYLRVVEPLYAVGQASRDAAPGGAQ